MCSLDANLQIFGRESCEKFCVKFEEQIRIVQPVKESPAISEPRTLSSASKFIPKLHSVRSQSFHKPHLKDRPYDTQFYLTSTFTHSEQITSQPTRQSEFGMDWIVEWVCTESHSSSISLMSDTPLSPCGFSCTLKSVKTCLV